MKYSIGFSYTEMGRIVIEAGSQEEAIGKLEKALDYDGLPKDFDVTDREWFVDEYGVEENA